MTEEVDDLNKDRVRGEKERVRSRQGERREGGECAQKREKKSLRSSRNKKCKMDVRFKKNASHFLAGPSGCGKTYRIADILKLKDDIFVDGISIKNVVVCYAAWQPIYEELKNKNIVTKWVNSLPTNDEFISLVEDYRDNGGSIVVIDDFMRAITKDLVQIFTVTSRHYNTTSFILLQNLFPPNPLARTLSLNCRYIHIHKNPRENSQIQYLARQIKPNNYKWIVEAYHEATKENAYACFLIDLTQEQRDILRFRSDILPHEWPMKIWVAKGSS